jgi:hypothetical protein
MDSGLPFRGILTDDPPQKTLRVDVDMEKVTRPSQATWVQAMTSIGEME